MALLADHAIEMLHERERGVFPDSYWPEPLQWRMGKDVYMTIAEESAPAPGNHEALDDLGPAFKAIADEADRRRKERLDSAGVGWGKLGTMLWGYPVVCDEDFEGLALELVGEQEHGAVQRYDK